MYENDEEKGNTPTGVGKTANTAHQREVDEKHPHGRGEDASFTIFRIEKRETPPRAWGRRLRLSNRRGSWGNTPTGVGKTLQLVADKSLSGKHPHGRGEDKHQVQTIGYYQETPPRAWGRLHKRKQLQRVIGNTPTGVGKTDNRHASDEPQQKHPHGRGEDRDLRNLANPSGETPPRAWGRHTYTRVRELSRRNTPTGVGKTKHDARARIHSKKHPHGRGEDVSVAPVR